MENNTVILHVEDDMEHALLVQNTLKRKGIMNEIIHFLDAEEFLNFLFRKGDGAHRTDGVNYILLLDIRLPKIDGVEVLRQIKADDELKEMPVIMLTASDDQVNIDRCHELGCSLYITKPLDFGQFADILREFGVFLKMVMQI